MPQLSILDALDAAGAHPQAVRPPRIEADYVWRTGDPVPPGVVPPVESEPGALPRYWPRGFGYDPEIASEVWQAIIDSIPVTTPEIPVPFTCIIETHLRDDGGRWACLVAQHDGGLSYVVLRDGALEWEEAPGAGMIIWRQTIHAWSRLPAKKFYDAGKHAWVWKDASAHPDMEPPETLASDTPDVAPEPVPTGLPSVSGGPAAFLHAHNLASDLGWRALAGSLDRTTPGDVRTAAARHVASGTLSLANATALLACIEDTEENAAPEHEGDEPDTPPDPTDFLANIWRLQEMNRGRKGVKWCPLRSLIDAGLATQVGTRVVLLPPASDALEMRHRARPNRIARVEFTLREGVDPASEIVRRVEELARIGVHPDAPLISTRRSGAGRDRN